jgi:hypothetical protein
MVPSLCEEPDWKNEIILVRPFNPQTDRIAATRTTKVKIEQGCIGNTNLQVMLRLDEPTKKAVNPENRPCGSNPKGRSLDV